MNDLALSGRDVGPARNVGLLSLILLMLMLPVTACAADRSRASESQAWELVEELRIGAAEGTGPTVFGEVSHLGIDALGRIYVLDGLSSEIRVFDATGEWVRSIGLKGEGPGELGGVIGMAFGPLDHLWLIDAGLGRYTVFDTAGRFVSDRPRRVARYDADWPGGFSAAGQLFDQVSLDSDGSGVRQALLGLDRDGVPTDTVFLPPYAAQSASVGSMRFPFPFSRHLVIAWDPMGGVWLAETDRYRIVRMSLSGDTTTTLERDVEPRALTPAEADSLNAYVSELRSNFPVTIDLADLPRVRPIIEEVLVDCAGERIWVFRAEPGLDGGQPEFDLFDAEGAYRGSALASFPILTGPDPVICGDRLLAVTADDLGIHYVVRARLRPR